MNIKKLIKIILVIIILIILALIILYFIKSGKYKKTDEIEQLKSKVSQEVYFLDDYLISIANSLNNINLENYTLKSETILSQSDKNSSSSSGEEKESQGNSNIQNKSSEGESGSENKNNNKVQENAKDYELKPSDILINERTADWESVKIAVERLYPTWSTISIDLYKLNVDNKIIQEFSQNLDLLTVSIQEEDKTTTLTGISKLHDYLSTFGGYSFSNNLENSILRTKSNILKAYSIIESEEWDNIKNYLMQAENEYVKVMGSTNQKNEYNINKTYLELKEFQTSVDTKNKDVLYIKYKNLLDELNILNI